MVAILPQISKLISAMTEQWKILIMYAEIVGRRTLQVFLKVIDQNFPIPIRFQSDPGPPNVRSDLRI